MADTAYYLNPGDMVEWDGKNWIYYPSMNSTRGYKVEDVNSDHPYIVFPDPREEDFWEGGEWKGDIEREGG